MDHPYRQTPGTESDASLRRQVRYARSLEEALPFHLIALDKHGNVGKPSLALRIPRRPLSVFLLAVGVGVLGLSFVYPMAAIYFRILAVVYLFVGAVAVVNSAYLRAVKLIAQGNDDEAEKALHQQLDHHILGAAYQTSAQLLLGRIHLRRARYADALDCFRAVRYLRPGSRRIDRLARLHDQALSAEVITLCHLGRDDEAKALFASFKPGPGNLVDLQTRTASLYLGICTRTPVTERELQTTVSTASRMASGYWLLTMCAWHFAQKGDAERVRTLLEAEEKLPHGSELSVAFPRLAGWVKERETAS